MFVSFYIVIVMFPGHCLLNCIDVLWPELCVLVFFANQINCVL